MILYMACDTGATGLTGRREYTFLQKPLSRRCFEHIIGISSHRVDKIGCFDQRYASNKKPSKPSLLTASIDSFLLVLYGSVAEPLPNKFLDAFSVNFILVFGHVTPTKKLDKTPLPSPRFIRQGAAKGKTKPGPAEDSDTDQWNGGVEYSSELEQDDDDLVHFLQSNSCFLFNVTQTNAFHVPLQQFVLCHVYAFAQKWRNIYIYTHVCIKKSTEDVGKLVRKYLPPGTVWDLYQFYAAWCGAHSIPSQASWPGSTHKCLNAWPNISMIHCCW